MSAHVCILPELWQFAIPSRQMGYPRNFVPIEIDLANNQIVPRTSFSDGAFACSKAFIEALQALFGQWRRSRLPPNGLFPHSRGPLPFSLPTGRIAGVSGVPGAVEPQDDRFGAHLANVAWQAQCGAIAAGGHGPGTKSQSCLRLFKRRGACVKLSDVNPYSAFPGLRPKGLEEAMAATSAKSPRRDLQHLGEGVWFDRAISSEPVVMIRGTPHARFLDHLFLPVATHALTSKQVVVINRYRTAVLASDPQFSYNRRVRRIFSQVSERMPGRILEIGPSLTPIAAPDPSRIVLCDLDNQANAANAASGHSVIEPARLSECEDASFEFTLASFVFHFAIGTTQAEQLARTLAPSGLIMFNVLTKLASTRTNAVSLLSNFGLRFACIDLCPTFGKEDVLFIGSKYPDPALFRLAGRIIRDEISRGNPC